MHAHVVEGKDIKGRNLPKAVTDLVLVIYLYHAIDFNGPIH